MTGHTLNARMLGTPLGASNVFFRKSHFVRRHRLPPYVSLRLIIQYFVGQYVPAWSHIRNHSSMCEGPSNFLCLQSVTEAAGAVVGDEQSGTNVSAVGCHRREMPKVISKQS